MSNTATIAAPPAADPAKPGALARFAKDMRELVELAARVLYYCFRGRREPGSVAREMYSIGNRSLFFLVVTMGVIGVILVFQSGMQAAHVVPDHSALGPFYLKLLVRDLAASIGSMPLATRVGAGIAAEIGTMVVTEQADALRMCAAEPVDYLVVPRFIGSLVMTLVLLVVAAAVAAFTGMITANVVFDVNFHTFLDFRMVNAGDVITGVAKCVAYGAAIPIVASKRGLEAFGGSEGVGRATTNAVVHSTLAVIVLSFLLSGIAYVIFPD